MYMNFTTFRSLGSKWAHKHLRCNTEQVIGKRLSTWVDWMRKRCYFWLFLQNCSIDGLRFLPRFASVLPERTMVPRVSDSRGRCIFGVLVIKSDVYRTLRVSDMPRGSAKPFWLHCTSVEGAGGGTGGHCVAAFSFVFQMRTKFSLRQMSIIFGLLGDFYPINLRFLTSVELRNPPWIEEWN